jgi:hypothetical protein
VLSAITAVEIITISKDDILETNDDRDMTDSEDGKEKEEGMVTRGRANKARTIEPKVATPAKKPSRKRATGKSRGK